MEESRATWQVEQVLALAPKPSALAAVLPLATPARWQGLGCDDRLVWGRCTGTTAEPYETVVDHVAVATRCSCPSRSRPCKHSLALLLLWARGHVPRGEASPAARSWSATKAGGVDTGSDGSGGRVSDDASGVARADAVGGTGGAAAGEAAGGTAGDVAGEAAGDAAGGAAGEAEVGATRDDGGDPTADDRAVPPVPAPPDPASSRDERVARMHAGLADLDRWLDDRVRTGLADPSLARYATWDDLAARLVDARVGGLANRVRRLAGVGGAGADWHQHLLAEMGMLHLLATAGRRLGTLPPALADSVATALGWQVRQADVLAGVPHTDHWVVMGRSDTREDRIEVRRHWLLGTDTARWAMLLSFAAYGQSLDDSLSVGTQVHADLFRYPGVLGLRALLGRRHADATPAPPPAAGTVAAACDALGAALAAEPWLERYPVTVLAAPAPAGGRWVLTDASGSFPLAAGAPGLGALVACSGGEPVAVTCEWTPAGLVPLTAHLADRAVDLGPTADPSFVQAAS
jgi:hypothetical protein